MGETPRSTDYDFRQAHTLSAEQLRELQDHCGNLCRSLQRFVPESMGLAAGFAIERTTATTYDEYLDELPESPIMAVCELVPNGSPVVWQIDVGPALAYMDAMLGGDGVGAPTEERELTFLERSLASEIVEEFMFTWADAWPALQVMGPRVLEVRQTTGRFGTVSLQEPAMAIVLSCSIAEVEGHMRIAMPTMLLRSLLKQPGAAPPATFDGDVVSRAATSEIGKCSVVVSARLAQTKITLRELRELRVGNVVGLNRGPRDQPDVTIAGLPKFRGISGLVNGRLAVRVTEQLVN